MRFLEGSTPVFRCVDGCHCKYSWLTFCTDATATESVCVCILQIVVCRPTSSVANCLWFRYAWCDKTHAFRPTALFSNLHNCVISWLKFYTLFSRSRQLPGASVSQNPNLAPPEKKFLAAPLTLCDRQTRSEATI